MIYAQLFYYHFVVRAWERKIQPLQPSETEYNAVERSKYPVSAVMLSVPVIF